MPISSPKLPPLLSPLQKPRVGLTTGAAHLDPTLFFSFNKGREQRPCNFFPLSPWGSFLFFARCVADPPFFPRDGGDLSWMPGSGASLIPGYFLPWCLILGRQIIRSGWGERRRARQWVLRQGAHLSTLSPVAAGARLGEIRWCWACMQGAQAVSGRLKGVWIWEGGASAACSLCLLLIRH